MPPKTGINFVIIANSTIDGNIYEKFLCTSSIANERSSRIAFESKIFAEFIDPLLKFSDKNVLFE